MANTARSAAAAAEAKPPRFLTGDVLLRDSEGSRVILAKGTREDDAALAPFLDRIRGNDRLWAEGHLEPGNYARGGPGGFQIVGGPPA